MGVKTSYKLALYNMGKSQYFVKNWKWSVTSKHCIKYKKEKEPRTQTRPSRLRPHSSLHLLIGLR